MRIALTTAATFFGLRQQMEKTGDKPHFCISDFVSADQPDYVGGFAVTAGDADAEIAERFRHGQ
jgi:5-methyltetrahydrofolate--homocysteine methyltransferase